jgi:DNA-binding SARP family transcriptional activator
VINYSVLGEVTARDGSWEADLPPQQQRLLAVLVLEGGKPVPRASLARVLWDEADDPPQSPGGALKRVVSELRAGLRDGPAAADLVPAKGDTYRLRLEAHQADVLRFRAKISQARRSDGREASTLMNAALREWGPDAAGLFGGNPLSGLRGRWAEASRETLRTEYRDARFQCLWQDYQDHEFDQLAAECRKLASEPDALLDEKFLELWMFATYRAGQRTHVERIYQNAMESSKAHLGVPLSSRIRRLATLIRSEDARLKGPGDLFESDLLQLNSASPEEEHATGPSLPTGEPHQPPGDQVREAAGPGHRSPATDSSSDPAGGKPQPAASAGTHVVLNGPVDAKWAVIGTQINHGRQR